MTKQELIEIYGEESYETAIMLTQLTDIDSAWSVALEEGLEDVAEIIEELYFEDEDV